MDPGVDERAPEEGDIVWVDLEPVRGTEQGGWRPALVVSSTSFNAAGHRSIVCPITTNAKDWPTKIPLPPGCGVEGFVLADQVRSLDRASRGFRKVGKASDRTLTQVRRKVVGLIGGTELLFPEEDF